MTERYIIVHGDNVPEGMEYIDYGQEDTIVRLAKEFNSNQERGLPIPYGNWQKTDENFYGWTHVILDCHREEVQALLHRLLPDAEICAAWSQVMREEASSIVVRGTTVSLAQARLAWSRELKRLAAEKSSSSQVVVQPDDGHFV